MINVIKRLGSWVHLGSNAYTDEPEPKYRLLLVFGLFYPK